MAAKIDDERETLFERFDEKAYIEKEMGQTKVSLMTLGYAIIMGFASFAVTWISRDLVPVGFFLGIIAIVNLKIFYNRAGIDISKFEKSNWFGSGAMVFFCWLAVWVILSNPPVSDLAEPSVDNVEVYKVDNATVELGILVAENNKTIEFSNYAGNMTTGDVILFRVDIVDNFHLEKDSLEVRLHRPDGTTQTVRLLDTTGPIKELFATGAALEPTGNDTRWWHDIEDESYFFAVEIAKEGQVKGKYSFTIQAKDSFDNEKNFTFTKTVD